MSKVRCTLKYSCEFPLTINEYLAPERIAVNKAPSRARPGPDQRVAFWSLDTDELFTGVLHSDQ